MRTHIGVLAVALLVGHGGVPLPAVRQPAARAFDASHGEAARLLDAARGVSPVICTLAATSVAQGYGYKGVPLGDSPEAATIYWTLRPRYDGADIDALAAGMRDEDSCVRAVSARLLATAGESGVTTLLGAVDDREPHVRRVAVEGLGFAEYRSASGALVRALRDADADVRAAAAWALGRVEATNAVDELAVALNDPALHVRLAAIDAFAQLELEETVVRLLPLLQDSEPRVRVATARALGDMLD